MLYSSAFSSPMKWGYAISRLMVIQSWLSIKFKGEYEVWHEDLVPYHHAVIEIANSFDGFYISHVSRFQNTKADALVALVATLALLIDIDYYLTVVTRRLVCPKHVLETNEVHVTSIVSNLEIGIFLSLTMLYMTYYQTTLRK